MRPKPATAGEGGDCGTISGLWIGWVLTKLTVGAIYKELLRRLIQPERKEEDWHVDILTQLGIEEDSFRARQMKLIGIGMFIQDILNRAVDQGVISADALVADKVAVVLGSFSNCSSMTVAGFPGGIPFGSWEVFGVFVTNNSEDLFPSSL